MMELDKIYNEDCKNVMQRMEENSIDLICTDPPYMIRARRMSGLGGFLNGKESLKGHVFEHDAIDIKDYIELFYKILKIGGHCYVMCNGYNFLHFLDVIRGSRFKFCKMLIWDKQNVIANQYYMNGFEYIFFLYKEKAVPINNCGTSDILKFANIKTKDSWGNNIHNSQKPVSLMQCLIENSTKEGEIVLDPFMGSGTTAIACMRSNRHYIGCEIDPKYYKVTIDRIEREKRTPTLF